MNPATVVLFMRQSESKVLATLLSQHQAEYNQLLASWYRNADPAQLPRNLAEAIAKAEQTDRERKTTKI